MCMSDVERSDVDDSCHSTSLLQVGLHVESTPERGALRRRGESDSDGVANLCMNGRLVPELYLIGAMKAGTTSLADELLSSKQVVLIHNTNGIDEFRDRDQDGFQSSKEPHYFDWRYKHGRETWLSWWPKCQHDARQVAADFTPQMHFTISADRMVSTYGDLSKRLRFIVILRDPLVRFHSSFFHLFNLHKKVNVNFNSILFPNTTTTMNFSQYVRRIMRDPPACNQVTDPSRLDLDPFCSSLYAEQLHYWFQKFDAAQFTIYPISSLKRVPGEPSVVESVWAELGIHGSPPAEAAHDNAGTHGTLLDDLDGNVTLMRELSNFLATRTSAKKVAKILTAFKPNMYKFVGDSNDEEDVSKWLEFTDQMAGIS